MSRQCTSPWNRRHGIAAAAFTVGVLLLTSCSAGQVDVAKVEQAGAQISGLQTFEVTAEHVEGEVAYAQTPPVGGDHSPIWLNCGIYDSPVPNVHAVHALEHGAVWITYNPALPAEQVEVLTQAANTTYMVLSPFEGLSTTVVVSAWGLQVALDGVDDPRLGEFIRAFRQGPQTPEPGAPCTGGTDGDGGGGTVMNKVGDV